MNARSASDECMEQTMSTTQPFPSPHDLAVPLGKFPAPRTNAMGVAWDSPIEATRKLFPGDLEISTEFDPEYPGQEFTILQVGAEGDVDSIFDRESQWVAMLNQLAPGVRGIRLCIDPRP